MKKSRMQGTWLVILLVLLVMMIWTFLRPELMPEGSLGTLTYYLLLIAQETVFFGLPALLLRPWWSHGVHRSPHWRFGCLMGLLAGLVLALLVAPLSAGWSGLLNASPQQMPLPASPVEWLALVLATVIVPALTEEAFFRGGVLCGLARGVGGKTAFLLTVVLFTLMHGRIAALPAHLACGFLFTLIMLRYGKLWPSIVAHIVYNAVMLALAWFGLALPWISLAATIPAMVAIAVVILRRTVWCDHKDIDPVDVALGVITMFVLVFYFLIQFR